MPKREGITLNILNQVYLKSQFHAKMHTLSEFNMFKEIV